MTYRQQWTSLSLESVQKGKCFSIRCQLQWHTMCAVCVDAYRRTMEWLQSTSHYTKSCPQRTYTRTSALAHTHTSVFIAVFDDEHTSTLIVHWMHLVGYHCYINGNSEEQTHIHPSAQQHDKQQNFELSTWMQRGTIFFFVRPNFAIHVRLIPLWNCIN